MANYYFSNYVCAKYASFLVKKPVSVTHLEKFSHVLMSFSDQIRYELLNPPQNKKSDEADKVLTLHFHMQTIKKPGHLLGSPPGLAIKLLLGNNKHSSNKTRTFVVKW